MLILALLCCLISTGVQAETQGLGYSPAREEIPTIQLQSGEFMVLPARGEAGFHLDYQRELTAERLVSQLDRFATVETSNLGYDALAPGKPNVWFHFRVRNSENEPGQWIVNLNRPAGTMEVEAFRTTQGGTVEPVFRCVYDDCDPLKDSPFIAGTIALEPGEIADILIVQPHRFSSQSPISFASPQSFALDLAQRDNRIWAMNGIWIALVAIALLFGNVIGWRLALAFASYSIAALLLFGLAEGTLKLIPAGLVIPFAEDFLLQFGLIFLVTFIRQFFRSKRNFPRLDLALKAIVVLSIINLIPIALGLGAWARVFTQVFILATHVIQTVAAIQAARAGWHGAFPVLIGAIVIFASALTDLSNKVVPGLLQRREVLELGHAAFLTEALLFAVAIVLKVLALQRERDRALREQLSIAEEKLRVDRELEASRVRFDKARKDAESSRKEIQAIGHDLMQPLGALRQALTRRSSPSPDEHERLEIALGLIEGIARREGASQGGDRQFSYDDHDQHSEVFELGLVIENVYRMFAQDAKERRIILKTVHCTTTVRCDPVALVRITSNLVVNALRHARCERILIGCRQQSDAVRLEIIDDGQGLGPAQFDAALTSGRRAEQPRETGMGLSIVQGLCKVNGLTFAAHSTPGKGSRFSVTIPRA